MEGQPTVRVSPQKAGRPDPPSVQGTEGRAEVRALGSGSVGTSILAQGAFEGYLGLQRPCPFSRPESPAAPLAAWVGALWQGESGSGAWGPRYPA